MSNISETVRSNLIKYLEFKGFQVLKSKRPNEILILTININYWIEIKYWLNVNSEFDQKLKISLCGKNNKVLTYFNCPRNFLKRQPIHILNSNDINSINNEIKIYNLEFMQPVIVRIIDRIRFYIPNIQDVQLKFFEEFFKSKNIDININFRNKKMHKYYIFPIIYKLKNEYDDKLKSIIKLTEVRNIIISYFIVPLNIYML